jgi:hypothetical protein
MICIRAGQVIAQYYAVRLVDRRMDADPKDNNRCDWVQQFSKFGSRAFSSIVLQHRAPTSGLGSRTPMAAWCESISGKFIDKGVDMTRRLNNAGALPTCPQP